MNFFIKTSAKNDEFDEKVVFFENISNISYELFCKILSFDRCEDSKGAKECRSCRSRKMLKNETLVAKIGFDTEENEPAKVSRK